MATRTDKGFRRFMKHAGEVVGVGVYSAVHFKNPADSGYTAVLKRIILDNAGTSGTEENFYVVFGRLDANLDGVLDATYSAALANVNAAEDAASDSSVCVTATNRPEDDATDVPTADFGKIALVVNSTVEVSFHEKGKPKSGIVLGPGTGFVVKCLGNDNNDIDVTFDWIEWGNL